MSKGIQAIRGMNDYLPAELTYWHYIEATLRRLTAQYNYHEIRTPVLESTALFNRSIGETTDIVSKEMYTFDDRNGDSLTLRPEGTASVVRAGLQHGLIYNQTQKLWYLGPIFRHERPQKGRYRQFYQFGLEAYGYAGPDIDAEIVMFIARLWRELGLEDHLHLQINMLGSQAERAVYREKLVDYFSAHQDQLDEDSQRRLHKNPLRILDTKNPEMKALVSEAPSIFDCLGDESIAHFEAYKAYLDRAGIKYTVNHCLVRGLDYYSHIVFEWVTDHLGAQGTVAAGGRYDVLIEQLGGKPTPAVGFAMGIERLVLLLAEIKGECPLDESPDIYFVLMGQAAENAGFQLAEQLRDDCPNLKLQLNFGGGNFKNQLKRADKSGARFAVILGDDEVENEQVTIKSLREDKPQERIAAHTLSQFGW